MIGEEVSSTDVRHQPIHTELTFDQDHAKFRDYFKNPKLITLIMTIPVNSGGEYLHWLATDLFNVGHNDGCSTNFHSFHY